MKPKPDLPWRFGQQSRNIFLADTTYERNRGWRARFLLNADDHIDSKGCNREMKKRHSDEALKEGAGIISVGDFLDVMQHRQDKRHQKTAIRSEYYEAMSRGKKYFDTVVDDAVELLTPYAHNYLFIGVGNHEQKVIETGEWNITDRMLGAVNHETGANIYNGLYSGFVRFRFKEYQPPGCKTRAHSREVLLYYAHGSGGDSPSTKGMNKHERRVAWAPQADIICSAHNHHFWTTRDRQIWCPQSGPVRNRDVTLINLPSYCDGRDDSADSWETRNDMAPKVQGGVFLEFNYRAADNTINWDVGFAD